MSKQTYHERRKLVHGYKVTDHPLYATWASMLDRCRNPNSQSYKNYGGRGISVCKRWVQFENFALDMGLKPNDSLTLERMDVNGNYEPSNCCWETPSNQCVNRRIFSSNTTGATGVVKGNYSWEARFDYEHTRYNLGKFMSKGEAVAFRALFLETFFLSGVDVALALLPEETVWLNTTSGARGVREDASGSFVTRCTVNGERVFIGSFGTLREGVVARRKFLDLAEEVGLDEALKSLPTDTPRSNSTTGVKGVTYKHKDRKFHLRVTVDGKRIYVGGFKTLDEAKDARARFVAETTK